MKEKLKRELNSVEEAITLTELNDQANRREYGELKRRRRLLKRTIRKMCRLEKRVLG